MNDHDAVLIQQHCCRCAENEDHNQVLEMASHLAHEQPPGDLKDAAEALLAAAFKRALSVYELAGMPKL